MEVGQPWKYSIQVCLLRKLGQDFLGGPGVKTLHFQNRGHRFEPWLGKFHMPHNTAKEK